MLIRVLLCALVGVAASRDRVASLPGVAHLKEENYAGLIDVGSKGGQLFYWLTKARQQPSEGQAPLLLWLNGGPGASSLTGLLCENGPYRIGPNGTLVDNPHTWNTHYDVVFVDQPAGTGFSYCPTDDCYVTTLDDMAEQMYEFLNGFLALHPEYKGVPLYLTGESFAGKYIPFIASKIMAMASGTTGTGDLNLAGLMIGNPEISTIDQYPLTATYLRNLGLIGDLEETAAKTSFSGCALLVQSQRWEEATAECERWLDELIKTAGSPFRYDIRLYKDWTLEKIAYMSEYLNSDEVRVALHVGLNRTWNSGDGEAMPNKVSTALNGEIEKPTAMAKLSEVLSKGLKVMVYDGNQDGSPFNHLSTENAMKQLKWPGQQEFGNATHKPWKVASDQGVTVGGYTRSSGAFTFLVVMNAGHLLPTDQPLVALNMVQDFVSNRV